MRATYPPIALRRDGSKSNTSPGLTRRRFLGATGLAALGAARAGAATQAGAAAAPQEARYYAPLDDGAVLCGLCPWHCRVEPGRRGRCGVRENRDGRYLTLVYGRPCAVHNDPIEKKPLFHVLPGCKALSIATVGCNIECKFCQNWDISQASPDRVKPPYRAPKAIAELAAEHGSRVVAYTYSEPTIFFEYMADCARAARERGIGNVAISNGFIEQRPMKELCGLVDAVKIDLKAFTERFYKDVCSGELKPVLDTLKLLRDEGMWFELVVLVIPTLNDGADDAKRMCDWVVKELGPDVPMHFTRSHPAYKIRNLPRTPPATLHKINAIARESGCRYVYTGNLPGGGGETTACPECRTPVIRRYGHMCLPGSSSDGVCPKCSHELPGVWRLARREP